MSIRADCDSESLDWAASPSGTVWRKRLHLVGEPESGQVTSVVRYEAGARFPAHDHPEGEEILVLAGVFSDEHGDWPAGTFLLNPEGFHHAPFSQAGCVLFVKLRQFAGEMREHVAIGLDSVEWRSTPMVGGMVGVERKQLYAQPGFPDTVAVERWKPGADPGEREFPNGVELFVLAGQLHDEFGRYGRGHWVRLPVGTSHRLRSGPGAEIYVKSHGVSGLRSG